jgi:hypothetical protein
MTRDEGHMAKYGTFVPEEMVPVPCFACNPRAMVEM